MDCRAPFHLNDGGLCYLTREGLAAGEGNATLVPRSTVGNVYYDNQNRIRLIFTWGLNAQFAQSFKNSGYDLGKAVMSELKNYLIKTYGDDDTRYQARYAHWVGSIDEKSRYLVTDNKVLQYATVAVSLTLTRNPSENINTIRTVAGGIANWVAQGPWGVAIVPVSNAFGVGNAKRSLILPRKIEPRDDSTYYCAAPYGGMYLTGNGHTPRPLEFDFSC